AQTLMLGGTSKAHTPALTSMGLSSRQYQAAWQRMKPPSRATEDEIGVRRTRVGREASHGDLRSRQHKLVVVLVGKLVQDIGEDARLRRRQLYRVAVGCDCFNRNPSTFVKPNPDVVDLMDRFDAHSLNLLINGQRLFPYSGF